MSKTQSKGPKSGQRSAPVIARYVASLRSRLSRFTQIQIAEGVDMHVNSVATIFHDDWNPKLATLIALETFVCAEERKSPKAKAASS